MMIDSELLTLRGRWKAVLHRMGQLSEVSAANSSGLKGSAPQSKLPPGTRLVGRADLRDLSLRDYWEAKFNSAKGNIRQLHVFLFLAERDLALALRRQPQADPHENRDERERRVCDQYAGLSALEAALAENCSESWIRKVRTAGGFDPQTGAG